MKRNTTRRSKKLLHIRHGKRDYVTERQSVTPVVVTNSY